jgi:hypothetical protein
MYKRDSFCRNSNELFVSPEFSKTKP